MIQPRKWTWGWKWDNPVVNEKRVIQKNLVQMVKQQESMNGMTIYQELSMKMKMGTQYIKIHSLRPKR